MSLLDKFKDQFVDRDDEDMEEFVGMDGNVWRRPRRDVMGQALMAVLPPPERKMLEHASPHHYESKVGTGGGGAGGRRPAGADGRRRVERHRGAQRGPCLDLSGHGAGCGAGGLGHGADGG